MRWLLPVALFALFVGGAVVIAGDSPPPGPPTTRSFTLEAVAYACEQPEGYCLGYGAAAPGPTLEINLGDSVRVTLVNRIAETAAALPLSSERAAALASARVSFHIHGMALAAAMDGVGAHAGTAFVDSSVAPGESFEYRFRAAYPGAWHYHDHVLGVDGSEGAALGLYGAVVVRSGGETRPDRVLDIHLDDAGPHGGAGVGETFALGARIELVVVSLGNDIWSFRLAAPDGTTVGSFDLGPGMSERVVIPAASSGAYRWYADGRLDSYQGTVVVS